MNCDVIAGNALAERYLLGELSPAEQKAYERHYFQCERCFGELQSLQTIQHALQAAPRALVAARKDWVWQPRWRWFVGGAVAASIVALVFVLQQRPPAREPTAANQLPAAAAAPPDSVTAQDGHAGQAPDAAAGVDLTAAAAAAAPSASKSPSPVSRRVSALAHLARVVPPRYSASVLRGVSDEATLRFQEGMSAYTARDYAIAVQKLRSAAALDPSRPDIAFFLGASELLLGNVPGAVRSLKRTVAMGDTPFLEEAHFYLAKAYLKEGDAEQARAELTKVNALQGDKRQEADELLTELLAVPAG